MATVRWDRNMGRLETRLAAMEHRLEEEAGELLDEMADMGVNLMKQYIGERGTEESGKSGRIETGHMLESVDRTEVRHNKGRGYVKYGWGLNEESSEPYFEYQENGFRHWLSGKDIPPMHAFLDSYIQVRETFKERVRQLMRG
jgi:hypothetical protein